MRIMLKSNKINKSIYQIFHNEEDWCDFLHYYAYHTNQSFKTNLIKFYYAKDDTTKVAKITLKPSIDQEDIEAYISKNIPNIRGRMRTVALYTLRLTELLLKIRLKIAPRWMIARFRENFLEEEFPLAATLAIFRFASDYINTVEEKVKKGEHPCFLLSYKDLNEEPYNLMPEKIKTYIPNIHEQNNLSNQDKIVHVIYYLDNEKWLYYVTEYDPLTDDCYGLLIDNDEARWAFLNLRKLKYLGVKRSVIESLPSSFSDLRNILTKHTYLSKKSLDKIVN